MKNSLFVFGTNMVGIHSGGAARVAAEQYGAQKGVGYGPTGRAFAIPTRVIPDGPNLPIEVIRECVLHFLANAWLLPEVAFRVTAVGMHEDIAPLFKNNLPNVLLPRPWHNILFGAHMPERESFEF